jgi:hypothetical protein
MTPACRTVNGKRTQFRRASGTVVPNVRSRSSRVSVSTSSSGAPVASSVSTDAEATQSAQALAVNIAAATRDPSSLSSMRTRSPHSRFTPSSEIVALTSDPRFRGRRKWSTRAFE